jgi:hypothetical protein
LGGTIGLLGFGGKILPACPLLDGVAVPMVGRVVTALRPAAVGAIVPAFGLTTAGLSPMCEKGPTRVVARFVLIDVRPRCAKPTLVSKPSSMIVRMVFFISVFPFFPLTKPVVQSAPIVWNPNLRSELLGCSIESCEKTNNPVNHSIRIR